MTPSQAIARTREVIRRQYKALATEKSYVRWVRRYIAASGPMPAVLSSEQKLERFLTHLARDQTVAASTQNQAFNAIIYVYKEVLGRPLEKVNAPDGLEWNSGPATSLPATARFPQAGSGRATRGQTRCAQRVSPMWLS